MSAGREIRLLTTSDARRVAWKNGRGVTEELALWPAGSAFERGDFDWRISRAAVDEPGPFSTFPGFDRILVVTSGAGLSLDHGQGRPAARVQRLQPHRFSGDWTSTAALLAGPVADFNVLTRRGTVRADVAVLHVGPRRVRELLGAGHTFIHVLAGEVSARVTAEPSALALRAGQSLWVRGAQPTEQVELGGAGRENTMLLVRIETESP